MTILQITLNIAIGMLSLAMLLSIIRFVKGPSLADRIAAMDLISALMIGMIILYTMITHDLMFMNVALILSLVAFLGTMSFAYYLINQSPYE